MFANFDFDVIRRSLGYLFFDGMTFTLTLTGLGALGGLIFGTLIALMRLSGLKLLARIAGLYVDLMRSLPLVLVIFWFYFLVPYIGQWLTGASRPIQVGAFTSSLVTFTLFEAASITWRSILGGSGSSSRNSATTAWTSSTSPRRGRTSSSTARERFRAAG